MRTRERTLFSSAAVILFLALVVDKNPVLSWVFVAIAAVLVIAAIVVRRRAPRALIVGGANLRSLASVSNALDHLRYNTGRCAGPGENDCPALRGEPCPYRGYSAVVVIDDGTVTAPCGEAMGGVPELRVPRRLLADPLASVIALKAVRAMPDVDTAGAILTSSR